MNTLTTEQKINILCDNINYNSNEIENFIHKYNIPYTRNNNGTFLNLSLLDHDVIDELYPLLTIKNNDFIHDNINYNSSHQIQNITVHTDIQCPTHDTIKKITIKHTKLDYFILKTLNDNLNLI